MFKCMLMFQFIYLYIFSAAMGGRCVPPVWSPQNVCVCISTYVDKRLQISTQVGLSLSIINIYIYIYVCMYVCMYVCVRLYVCMYIYI